MTRFEIRTDVAARRLVWSGDLDVATAEQADTAAEPLAREPGDLTLDLAALTFIDASGLRVVSDIRRRLAVHGARLLVENVPGPARRTFTAGGLGELVGTA